MAASTAAAAVITAGAPPSPSPSSRSSMHPATVMTTPGGTTMTTTATILGTSSFGADPMSLLDSLDAYTSSRAAAAAALGASQIQNSNVNASSSSSTSATTTTATLDPVDFLNRHYTNEHMLNTQLPSLRMAVHDRMDSLEDRISTALQRQSETSETTRKHVQEAKLSIASLETRIRLVQDKASQSERAVLEITKDMKRLDCAKRHLQKTITTLKQLHMLVHAVEQLRLACLLKPFCDYRAASQLIDATRLLLKHFEAYTIKVQPMRLLSIKVTAIQHELLKGLVRGFRIVGHGLNRALEMEHGDGGRKAKAAAALLASDAAAAAAGGGTNAADAVEGDWKDPENLDEPPLPSLGDDDTMPVMTPQVMAEGTMLIDSLGADIRVDFIRTISHDHLIPYDNLFLPKIPPIKSSLKHHSFKRTERDDEVDKPPYSLEQVDRRFAWYRRTLRDVCDKFPHVFPTYWNFEYSMTMYFLEMVSQNV